MLILLIDDHVCSLAGNGKFLSDEGLCEHDHHRPAFWNGISRRIMGIRTSHSTHKEREREREEIVGRLPRYILAWTGIGDGIPLFSSSLLDFSFPLLQEGTSDI